MHVRERKLTLYVRALLPDSDCSASLLMMTDMAPDVITEFIAANKEAAAGAGMGALVDRRTWVSTAPVDSSNTRRASTWHAPDAYAFGVILYEVLTLQKPWRGLGRQAMWSSVCRGERPSVTAADEAAAPAGYIALMHELWAHDAVERPPFVEALRRLRAIAGQHSLERPRRVQTKSRPGPAGRRVEAADDLADDERNPTVSLAAWAAQTKEISGP